MAATVAPECLGSETIEHIWSLRWLNAYAPATTSTWRT